MKKIKLELDDEEYYEFRDLLEYCINVGVPFLNDGIAEKIAKMIEEEVY